MKERLFQLIPMWVLFCGMVFGIFGLMISSSNALANETEIAIRFKSTVLEGNRNLKIHLPDSYHDSKKSYPVFYVLDSDFLFDPAVVISKTRASRDLMPEVIIVGVSTPNTEERLSIGLPMRLEENSQLIFEDASPEIFLHFMEDELLPYIQSHYRVAEYRGLVGMSPTVGPVFHGYFTKSDLFQAWVGIAADVDRLTKDNQSITTLLIETAKKLEGTRNWLYISRGGIDINRNERMADAFQLLQTAFKLPESQAKAEVIVDGEHYASAIDSLDNAFSFFFPPDVWAPDYLTIRAGDNPVNDLKFFYSQLSQKYGFNAYPVNDGYWMGLSLMGTARYLIRGGRSIEAKEILRWGLEFSPNSEPLTEMLGELEQDTSK